MNVKKMLANAKAWVSKGRAVLSVLAGVAAEIIAMGVLHGTALTVVQAVVAAATALGVHVASKTAVKAAAK